jgi:hypothetical protein
MRTVNIGGGLMRRSTKSSQTKEHFVWPRPSPMFVVGVVAASIGLLPLTGSEVKRFFSDHLDSRISFEQSRARRKSDGEAQNRRPNTTTIFDGEVYRTEGRLREASAVAIAASLSGVATLAERRPLSNVGELLQDISRRGLLPPGIELVADRNLLISEHSAIHVRLRTEPFAVEILSLGRTRLDGAALLLRVPDEKQNQKEPTHYFYSIELEDIKVPDAFAVPSAVLACGWQMDSIRPAIPEGVSETQLATWASEQQSK